MRGPAESTDAHEYLAQADLVEQDDPSAAAEHLAQADPEWKANYRATRPKVERKIGHLIRRRHGGRRARVRGRLKVSADYSLLAAAANLARLAVLGITRTTSGWATATA